MLQIAKEWFQLTQGFPYSVLQLENQALACIPVILATVTGKTKCQILERKNEIENKNGSIETYFVSIILEIQLLPQFGSHINHNCAFGKERSDT
jgi:competence CoiA-like predicted nuclease